MVTWPHTASYVCHKVMWPWRGPHRSCCLEFQPPKLLKKFLFILSSHCSLIQAPLKNWSGHLELNLLYWGPHLLTRCPNLLGSSPPILPPFPQLLNASHTPPLNSIFFFNFKENRFLLATRVPIYLPELKSYILQKWLFRIGQNTKFRLKFVLSVRKSKKEKGEHEKGVWRHRPAPLGQFSRTGRSIGLSLLTALRLRKDLALLSSLSHTMLTKSWCETFCQSLKLLKVWFFFFLGICSGDWIIPKRHFLPYHLVSPAGCLSLPPMLILSLDKAPLHV